MAQPPLGSVTPADLYIDRGSRQLWLGVDPSVDATGSLLVSDILTMMSAIEQAETDAKAFTDERLLGDSGNPISIHGYSPTDHVHTSGDITDFEDAVIAIGGGGGTGGPIPAGLIAMYYGPLINIGTGSLIGWRLCDGTNGTPDLRNRFVYGASTTSPPTYYPVGTPPAYPPASFNVAQNVVVPNDGAHDHGAVTGNHTLTLAQTPSHVHTVSASGIASGNTGVAGVHTHTIGSVALTGAAGPANVAVEPTYATGGNISTHGATYTGAGASGTDHFHAVSIGVSVSGGTDAQGSGGQHSHTIPSHTGHTHTILAGSGAIRAGLNWVALAYIMKI